MSYFKKHNKFILIFLGILLTLSVLIGISYAYYMVTASQTNKNRLASSCISVSLTNEKNDIILNNAYPITNSEGKKLTPYQFTITNTCNIFISYNVNLEMLEGTDLSTDYIKTMVNSEAPYILSSLDSAPTTIDKSTESRTLAQGSLGSGDSVDYALRLWMDENTPLNNDTQNKSLISKIVVVAQPSTYKPSDYVTTLHDAILVNEYGVKNLDNAISKIEAKETPDFSKSAPIITWKENIENGTSARGATVMSEKSINSDDKSSNLTMNDTLLAVFKSKAYDSTEGTYTLSNRLFVDPTTLNYDSDEHYYFIGQYLTVDANSKKLYTAVSPSGTTVYEIIGATKSNTTTTYDGIEYNTIYYTLTVKVLDGAEIESDKSDKGIYSMNDEQGTSYYYRGNVENNNVYFANSYWKIIRINGDGTIRLLYNGKEKNAVGAAQTIGADAYNTLTNNPAYIGYMYGNDLTTKEAANKNEKDSTIKAKLENWYFENIENKKLDSFIADSGFCNDRRLQYGDGYSSNITASYMGYKRNYVDKAPSLICETNDLFTLKNSNFGNRSSTYPIGLITADELVLSGNSSTYANKSAYTYSTASYFSMTPEGYSSGYQMATIVALYSDGKLSHMDTFRTYIYIRPVINLKADVEISGGIGTVNDPYVIKIS